MNYTKIIFILITVFQLGCNNSNKQARKIYPNFEIPYIMQTTNDDSSKFESVHSFSYAYPPLGGKFKFMDTIDLKGRMDTAFYKNELPNFNFFSYKSDSLPTDGFELVIDYNVTVSKSDKYMNLEKGKYFYPAFIINQTPSAKVLIGKDRRLFAIQEAKDSNGIWRPIEQEGPYFCGDGFWAEMVYHNEYVVMLLPKYKGNFKTKLRIRLKNNATIYVSKPFDGMINYEQLYFDKTTNEYWKKVMQESFYGAHPIQLPN